MTTLIVHGGLPSPFVRKVLICLEKIHLTPSLYPSDPREYGRALFLEEYADTKIVMGTSPALFQGLIRPWFFKQPGDLALADKAIAEELGPSLDWLEPRVDAPTGIVAERYSIADIAVASQLVSLRYARRELDAERWPRIAAWFEATRARPAWKELAPKEVPPV